jgi:LPXTG-motif cell wall-anchored protein
MGMTTTTKILIGVGVVSVLGIGYYLFTKKK